MLFQTKSAHIVGHTGPRSHQVPRMQHLTWPEFTGMFDPHLHQFPHLKRSGDVFPHPVYWLLQFTEAKVYHNKLVNIRKEMILIHERTTKLKVISFNTSSFTPQRPCLLYDLRHRLCMCMYKDILELLIVLSYFVAPPQLWFIFLCWWRATDCFHVVSEKSFKAAAAQAEGGAGEGASAWEGAGERTTAYCQTS